MKPLLLTLALARGGDLGSTQYVLAHGGYEANPFLPQRADLNLAVGVGATALEMYWLRSVGKRHKKLGIILTIAAIGVESAATVHNIYVMR